MSRAKRPGGGPQWTCDRCGALNPPANLICWRCGGFRPTRGPTLRMQIRGAR